MKNFFLFLFLFISFHSVYSQSGTRRVLFIGNSYTYSNNLPQMLYDAAKSAGDTVIFDSSAPGGYTFQNHTTNSTSLTKIAAGNWDYVVLQEQSQLPSFTDGEVASMVFPYARQLDSLINLQNPCAETMFFMTWGRKNGDAMNCGVWPPVCTYEGMDSLLNLRYRMMADMNEAVVSPVGAVWHYIRANHPSIELYSTDESHPSIAGTYAAACSFYAVIFRKDPALIAYDGGLPAADAQTIRQAARAVAYDSLTIWHVGEYDPMAAFTVSPGSNQDVTFTNTSVNADNYLWVFGDGIQSTEENPTHTYLQPGNYNVTLIASHCQFADTIETTITIATTGTTIQQTGSFSLLISPNPLKSKANVILPESITHTGQQVEVCVYNTSWKKVYSKKTNSETVIEIDGNSFMPGLYYVVIPGYPFCSGKMLKE